jgi:hypothetical protein
LEENCSNAYGMNRLLKMNNNNRKRGGNEIPMARDELDWLVYYL